MHPRSFLRALSIALLTLLVACAVGATTRCDFVKVAAGTHHTLAIRGDGTVWAWGDNTYGQLGNGTNVNASVPVQLEFNGAPLTGVTAVAAGGWHSLALRSDGTVLAWGSNIFGALGDGTLSNRNTPVLVQNLPPSPITAIAAGSHHSLALTLFGAAFSWGRNDAGQLGNNTNVDRNLPGVVPTLPGVTAIAAGHAHSVAVSGGRVFCWGDNAVGQLGDGTTTRRLFVDINLNQVKTAAGDLTNVVAVSAAAGGNHVLALTSFGVAFSWGAGNYGQLGSGFIPFRSLAEAVRLDATTILTGVASVGAGSKHSLLRMSNGGVRACGSNEFGQIGKGSFLGVDEYPVTVVGLASATAVAGGGLHSVALQGVGAVYTWGRNEHGQLAIGDLVDRNQATAAANTICLADVSASHGTSLRLRADRSIESTGENLYGQLGDGTTADRDLFVAITALTPPATSLGAGGDHSLAVVEDGTLRAWGRNDSGQLGDGTFINRSLPVVVKSPSGAGVLTGITSATGGFAFSAALTNGGNVHAWGFNVWGQLGDGTTVSRSLPAFVKNAMGGAPLAGIGSIAVGEGFVLARTQAGTVWAWGKGEEGQLGNGANLNRPLPVQVRNETNTAPLTGIIAVAAGFRHAVALAQDGTVYTWGINGNHQLGNGTSVSFSNLPVRVVGLGPASPAVSIAAKLNNHTLVLRDTGSVLAWGLNAQGQLGTGSTTPTSISVPVVVSGLPASAGIWASSANSFVLGRNEVLYTWGSQTHGEMGVGDNLPHLLPVTVP